MIGSKELTMQYLDTLNNEKINSEIMKAKEELFNLRFTKATGQLEAHGRFKELRKDIARLLTVIHERQLGIRTEPKSQNISNNKEIKNNDIEQKDSKNIIEQKDTKQQTIPNLQNKNKKDTNQIKNKKLNKTSSKINTEKTNKVNTKNKIKNDIKKKGKK